ncbi:MAG TPA: ATP synthase subunit I [Thermoanaerobaculia bacterium]|nr:ATP synthase subunit I [Thermoanaerobaculia bacterium]
MDEEALRPEERETPADVLRRIKRTAFAASVVLAGFTLFLGGFSAFLGLTCSAAVTMISFLWLEEIVETLLQPAPHPKARRMIVRTLVRFLLLGVSLSVSIFVARFNAVSVLLGFSIIVIGIMAEAVYSLYRSLMT